MPRSGGIATLDPGYFAVDGTPIQVSQHNPVLEDIAAMLTGSLPRDGSAPMTGPLAMGSQKITGLAAGTTANDAVRFSQLPAAMSAWMTSVSALSLLANEMVYASGVNVAAKTPLTAFGRTLIDDVDAATARATLGLVIGTDVSAPIVAVQYMMVRDEKSNSTVAQSLTANTWTTRDINTVVHNSITGASLSSSVITLPAGTYRISASVPGFRANAFKARLRHNTSAITYGVSTSENSHSSFNTAVQALIKNEFTLGSTTDVKIEMIVQTTSNGGSPAGAMANNTEIEIYTVVELWKIA
jgi:hypothetical protein